VSSAVLTERPGTVVRRWWFWAAAGAFILVVAIVSTLIGASRAPGTPLSPTNPAPEGAKGLAEVLKQHGIDVVIPQTLAGAVDAAGEDGSTLLLDDPDGDIGSFGSIAIQATGARIVLLAPTPDTLGDYTDDVVEGGIPIGGATADCEVPYVRRAGSITGDATVYRLLAGTDGTACWLDGTGQARMVALGHGDHDLVVLGTTGLLANQSITEAGNAAFALGLLGATPRLVWFQPTERAGWSSDGGGTEPEAPEATVGSVSPAWVIPVMLLLIATAIAAAISRGRRFGPLMVEPLPAVVPADEAVRGRARLYARARARLRAADALRIGTIGRLAAALGLPSAASVPDVAAAVAAITGRSAAEILGLLRDAVPANDRDLVRLSDALTALETDLTRRMKP